MKKFNTKKCTFLRKIIKKIAIPGVILKNVLLKCRRESTNVSVNKNEMHKYEKRIEELAA